MALSDFSDDGRYRLLVEAVTDYAIYMLDAEGVVSSWNAGAQRFKGYEASEIIGQHFSRFYTDADQKIGLPQLALTTAAQAGKFESEGWRVRRFGLSGGRDALDGCLPYIDQFNTRASPCARSPSPRKAES